MHVLTLLLKVFFKLVCKNHHQCDFYNDVFLIYIYNDFNFSKKAVT